LLNSNISSTCSDNTNFGPLTAEIGSGVWQHPCKFQRVAPSVQRRKVWLTLTTRVTCSNAAKTRNPGVRRDEKGDGEIGREEWKRKVHEKKGMGKGREKERKGRENEEVIPLLSDFLARPMRDTSKYRIQSSTLLTTS